MTSSMLSAIFALLMYISSDILFALKADKASWRHMLFAVVFTLLAGILMVTGD